VQEFRCPRCGLLLGLEQFNRVEFKRGKWAARIYGTFTMVSLNCPLCNTPTEQICGQLGSGEVRTKEGR